MKINPKTFLCAKRDKYLYKRNENREVNKQTKIQTKSGFRSSRMHQRANYNRVFKTKIVWWVFVAIILLLFASHLQAGP